MVAYSFNPIFATSIERYLKRQTVRADRKRHARPGEPIQLYTGMRTRSCRKLLEVDPICSRVDEIRIVVPDIPDDRHFADDPLAIEINGVPLNYLQIEAFARLDGFGLVTALDENGVRCGTELVPHARFTAAETIMCAWWHDHYGAGPWHGVVIRWDPPE